MATPLTPTSDVAARLGRELTEAEGGLAFVLLGDAENMIRLRVPSGDLDDLDQDALHQVAANAVVRILRNPEGYRSESAGAVSYTIDSRVAAGFMTILADEWALLGLTSPPANGGAFSIAPSLGLPRTGGWPGGTGWPESWA